jgi:hypothetical protein
MPESFYRPAPDVLSQGDIVSDIPWGLVEAPTSLCRPVDAKKATGKAHYSTADAWQLPSGFPLPWSKSPEILHAIGWNGLGMILWHDCQIEKGDNQGRPEKSFAAVAPVLALETLQGNTTDKTTELRQGVRNNEHHSYFFLPAVTAGTFTMPDSYVNLRYIWSVRRPTLTKRFVSLQPNVLPAVYEKLFVFFTRFRIDVHPVCPKCGESVPLTSAQASDDDD